MMSGMAEDGALIEWDYMSRTLLPHMSFIMSNFHHYTEIKNEFTGIKRDALDIVLTGSSMEGLSLPLTFNKFQNKFPQDVRFADVDFMYVFSERFIDTRDTISEHERHYVLETNNMHPGYIRLELTNPETTLKTIQTGLFKTRKIYLDGTKMVKLLGPDKMKSTKVAVEPQGPAVTVVKTHDVSVEDLSYQASLKIDADLVIAVPVPQWPEVAQEWVIRHRTSGWPLPNVVNEIIAEGCHAVPVAHASSKFKEIEWRLSFSFAELKLARKLTVTQKKCYILFRILHNHAFNEPKGIVSYHLKTVLYWAAEEIPQKFWTEQSMAKMVLNLLDKLLHCLGQHNLPSYFIPANNLIDAVPADTVKTIMQKLIEVRRNPLKHLMQFNKCHKFIDDLKNCDLDELFKPVVEHGQNIQNAHCSLKACYSDVFRPVSVRFVAKRLMEYIGLTGMSYKLLQIKPIAHIDSAINMLAYCSHLVAPSQHPAIHCVDVLLELLQERKNDALAVKVCERLLMRFPDAPNRLRIQQQILSRNIAK